MRYFFAFLLFFIVAAVSVAGFRGQKSEKTPIYIFPDMDFQPRYKPQGGNSFFDNESNDRLPPRGSVIRATEIEDETFSADYRSSRSRDVELHTGKDFEGAWVDTWPLEITDELMILGREKYDITCAVCHGKTGNGAGVVSTYGVPAANLHLVTFVEQPHGELYNTVTWGKGQMLGYYDKLNPEERWAVVLYMRALQRAFNASREDIAPDKLAELGIQ